MLFAPFNLLSGRDRTDVDDGPALGTEVFHGLLNGEDQTHNVGLVFANRSLAPSPIRADRIDNKPRHLVAQRRDSCLPTIRELACFAEIAELLGTDSAPNVSELNQCG